MLSSFEPRESLRHAPSPPVVGLPLDPRVHGRGRVPGQRTRAFDLAAFARSLDERDLGRQLACYTVDAEIRVVGPDLEQSRPRTILGSHAILSWLIETTRRQVDVTHLVDGGDRVAFTQRWHGASGSDVEATSTAELRDGLITTQHMNLAWVRGSRPPRSPPADGAPNSVADRRRPRSDRRRMSSRGTRRTHLPQDPCRAATEEV